MDFPDLDTQQKIDELEGLLPGTDADGLYAAAIRARLAGEFRDSDGMIGLPQADPERVARMKQLASLSLDRAAKLGHVAAGVDTANRIYFSRQTDRAAEALSYVQRAGDDARALYLLGLFHYVGFGVDKDEVKSLDYHRRAAAEGEADAMFELYVFFSKGIGTEVDGPTAIAWCRKAAEAGSARAMTNMGGFYATGNGVEQDGVHAIGWYKKAAEAGSGRAAATLGIMYATGDSVEESAEQAREYFQQADDLGFPWEDLAEQCGLDPGEYA